MQRYLITCPADELWGIVVTSVGTQSVRPGEVYPPQEHPTRYLFKQDSGRTLDEFQLVFLSEGRGDFRSASGGHHRLCAGDAFMLFPGEWHTYAPDPDTGWTEYWIGIKGELPDSWQGRCLFSPISPVIHAGFSEEITTCYSKAIEIASQQKAGYQQALSGLAVRIITDVLFRAKNRVFMEDSSDQGILRAKMIIAQCDGITSPEEVATQIGMGYSRFRRIFKEYTGLSPARYMLEIRMAKAKELLTNTSMQIQEIAWKLGFENADYFITAFKRTCLTTPSDYRSRHA